MKKNNKFFTGWVYLKTLGLLLEELRLIIKEKDMKAIYKILKKNGLLIEPKK